MFFITFREKWLSNIFFKNDFRPLFKIRFCYGLHRCHEGEKVFRECSARDFATYVPYAHYEIACRVKSLRWYFPTFQGNLTFKGGLLVWYLIWHTKPIGQGGKRCDTGSLEKLQMPAKSIVGCSQERQKMQHSGFDVPEPISEQYFLSNHHLKVSVNSVRCAREITSKSLNKCYLNMHLLRIT